MTLSIPSLSIRNTLFPFLLGILLLQACGGRSARVEPTLDERLTKAKTLFEKKKYYDARQQFDGIRFDYPGDSRMDEVQYHIGRCLYHMEDYLNAETELRIFQRDFGSSTNYGDDVAYWLCKTVYAQALPARLDQAGTKKTLEEIHNFLEQFNGSEFTQDVHTMEAECLERLAEKDFLAGQQYRRMGSSSSAIHYFRLLEQDYPESRWIARCRYEWARSLYDQKNYADALNMTDSCAKSLSLLESAHAEKFLRLEPHSGAYKFFHLFGLIPYETRSDIKIYLDALKKDLAKLTARIQKAQTTSPRK